jgi:uncharacterized protein (TIGR02996 family)
MDEQAAFVRAICEQPADDTVRLVYADWLEENGEGKRADFIRSQIAAANGARVGSMHLWGLLHHSEKWFPDVCGVMGFEWRHWGVMYDEAVHYEHKNGRGEFFVRRGLVSEVWLTCAAFLKHAKELFSQHPITAVCLAALAASEEIA